VAYMNADTSPKVGFRPYGQTDAFGASHFMCVPDDGQADPSVGDGSSGMGVYYLNRPFDPWELYDDVHHTGGLSGLGQNHPFKPTAWKLHGLGQGTDPTAAAADELLSAGQITQAEHDAILEGSMGFVDVLGYDPTDQSSWNSLTNLFREVNADLKNLEAEYAANAPAPGSIANPTYGALGQQLIQQRQQYTNLASQFVRYYTLVMGTPPAGLSGLGIEPITYFVAGSIIFIVTAFIALYAIRTWAQGIDVSKIAAQTASGQQQTTATNTQALLQVLAKQQASGDTVGAQATLKALAAIGAQPAAPNAVETWLMNNAKWLGIGAAALIAIGPISQGLFGGRRR